MLFCPPKLKYFVVFRSVDATKETGRMGRLINHSKTGNCQTKLHDINGTPHLILVASRDIDKGEELLYDYGDRSKASIAAHPWLKYWRTGKSPLRSLLCFLLASVQNALETEGVPVVGRSAGWFHEVPVTFRTRRISVLLFIRFSFVLQLLYFVHFCTATEQRLQVFLYSFF